MMETLPLEQCYLSEHFDIFAKSWKCNEDTQRREISNIISYFRSLSNVMLASSGVSQVIFYTDLKEILILQRLIWKEPTHQIYNNENVRQNFAMQLYDDYFCCQIFLWILINFSVVLHPTWTQYLSVFINQHLSDIKEFWYIYILIPS